MMPLPPHPRTLLRNSLLAMGTLLAGQEIDSPFPALKELAAKACQPEQGKGVPLQARATLERFHARLAPWVLGRLTALRDGTTLDLGQRLALELEHGIAKVPESGDSFWHPLRFQVETPEAHPELIAVTARFGTDASMLLFRRDENGWKLLWQDRAPAYEDIDGAMGSYTTVMTPKGSDGAFFLAAARVTPWYQSNWQRAELRVFRFTPDLKVRRIGKREETIFLGVDNPMTLSASDAQHLAFRWQAGSNDPIRHNFSRIFHFRLGAGNLQRVPPYAGTPLDLVEEWLSLTWREAAALVIPSARAQLQAFHAYLSDHENNLLTFDETLPAAKGPDLWEVGAELERDDKFETVRFTVGKSEGDFRLLGVQRSPRP